MASKENQLRMFNDARPTPGSFTIAEVRALPNLNAALVMADQVSRLSDKQIYGPLRIDAGHYSRIMSGASHFPNDEKYLNFLNITDNDIPTMWAAERRGWDWSTIRRHGTDLEKENERLRTELEHKDRVIDEIINRGSRR